MKTLLVGSVLVWFLIIWTPCRANSSSNQDTTCEASGDDGVCRSSSSSSISSSSSETYQEPEVAAASTTAAAPSTTATSHRKPPPAAKQQQHHHHKQQHQEEVCGIASAHCGVAAAAPTTTTASKHNNKNNNNNSNNNKRRSTIYQYGGTAQAYKPNVPLDTVICDASSHAGRQRHKVASWPLTRWTRSNPSPTLDVTLEFWTCTNRTSSASSTTKKKESLVSSFWSSSSSSKKPQMDCCCQHPIPLLHENSSTWMVEVWQARPDGTYASIRPGKDDGDCRARTMVDPSTTSKVTFRTVAPGSVGTLGGLVPVSSLDWMPYKPPVLHLLVSSSSDNDDNDNNSNTPFMLVDVPILFHPKTLAPQNFSMASVWRGPEVAKDMATKAAKRHQEPVPIQIASWTPHPQQNHIDVVLHVYLPTTTTTTTKDDDNPSSTEQFCNSLPFGFPASFFMEPIAMCAPSVLDFFDL